MQVGLFFGSFNPIHVGHLIIANLVRETTSMDEVWFVVSPQNPFKKSKNLLHEFDRLDMVQAAVADDYHLRVSDIEFSLPKPSYTIHTLAHLREKHPKHQFKLIIGEDNLTHFHKWKNHDQILSQFGLIVYPRSGPDTGLWKGHDNVERIQAPILDISATQIRSLIREGKSIKYLVPEEVREMIIVKKFFR